MLDAFKKWMWVVGRNKHFKYGVPFLALLVGSSFALTEVNSVRYDYRSQKKGVKEEDLRNLAKRKNVVLEDKEQLTLEAQHEKYLSQTPLEDYEIRRGPRPWEDNADYEELLRNNKKIKPPKKSASSYGV